MNLLQEIENTDSYLQLKINVHVQDKYIYSHQSKEDYIWSPDFQLPSMQRSFFTEFRAQHYAEGCQATEIIQIENEQKNEELRLLKVNVLQDHSSNFDVRCCLLVKTK